MVSVAIIARDKSEILPQCRKSAHDLSDDVVIITNADHKFVDYSDQKNYAASKCKYNWVLSLDSDEVVSPQLAREIKQVLPTTDRVAFKISRLNYIFGKPMRHSNWEPKADTHIWLWRKAAGRWVGVVHEEVMVKGKVQQLKGQKIHYNYSTVEQYLAKMNDYTSRETKAANPVFEFWRRYVWHFGFLDGWHGLFLSYLQAISHLVVWVKLREGTSSSLLPS